MLLSTADADGEPLLLLAPGDLLLAHREVGPLLLELLAQPCPPRSPAAAPSRAANASRVSPGREAAFVTGSRKTATASLSSSRSLSAFSIPFAPGGGEPRRQVEVAQARRARRRRRPPRPPRCGSASSVSAGVAPAERPRAHADRLVRSLVAHRVLHEQVRRRRRSPRALRQVEVPEGRRQHGRRRPAPPPRVGACGRGRGRAAFAFMSRAISSRVSGPRRYDIAQRDCEEHGRLAVDVVEQEDALLRRGEELRRPPPARAPRPASPLASRSRSCCVCSVPDHPGAHVGEALVVEVDGVLRREHDAHALRARLLEQRQQRPLRRRVRRVRREVAEDLVHVDERAQLRSCRPAGASRSSPCRGGAR